MFDLIQNHQQQVFVPPTHNEPQPSQQNTGAWHEEVNQENNLNLIEVSDDEDDDLSDDSREVSDNDDSDFEEDTSKKLSLEGAETIQMNSNDIKKIVVPLHNVQTEDLTENNPLEEVTDSLDELDDEDEDDEDEEEDEEDKEIFNNTNELKQHTFVMKAEAEEEEEEEEEEKDYTKFKVTELRAMAAQKGLSNYKKLKKSPLIELIKASE